MLEGVQRQQVSDPLFSLKILKLCENHFSISRHIKNLHAWCRTCQTVVHNKSKHLHSLVDQETLKPDTQTYVYAWVPMLIPVNTQLPPIPIPADSLEQQSFEATVTLIVNELLLYLNDELDPISMQTFDLFYDFCLVTKNVEHSSPELKQEVLKRVKMHKMINDGSVSGF